MEEGVNTQEAAAPESQKDLPQQNNFSENARQNFARLESAREAEREARMKAEMQAQLMRQELEMYKESMKPKEKDPLDDIDDMDDPATIRNKFKLQLEKERVKLKREAKEIAKETYAELKKQDDQENVIPRLRSQYSDYDAVMNKENLSRLEQEDPVFLETVLLVGDDFERRQKTYKKLKSLSPKPQEPKLSIKEKVEENSKNPFYIPAGSGHANSPVDAIDFDVKSPAAKQHAYAKMKAAQRRPLGTGHASYPG